MAASAPERSSARALWLVGAWWALLAAAVIAIRPATVADETRYLSVAWSMHQGGDLLLLRLNGQLYGHKPPLLFWLIDIGWRAFGPNLWWPRLLTAVFGFGALVLIVRLVRRLVPERDDVAALAVLVTGSALAWTSFAGAVMFDLVLAFFVLLALLNVVRATGGAGVMAWVVVGVATGLGILTKGPVALLHVLPLAVLAPWWAREAMSANRISRGSWYAGVAVAVLVAAATALAWAIPAAIAGGEAFRTEILWRQSAGRIASEGYHARPFWFHLAVLPVLLLPWSVYPSAWRGAAAALRPPMRTVVRFALAWVVPVVVAFSLIKGKQLHYLLPEVAGFALLAAAGWSATASRGRRMNAAVVATLLLALAAAIVVLAPALLAADEQWRIQAVVAALAAISLGLVLTHGRSAIASASAVGTACVAALLAGYVLLGPALLQRYDMAPFARAIGEVQQRGEPVAHFGVYHGEYQYIGRLQYPLEIVHGAAEALTWARAHPHGAIVVRAEQPMPVPEAQPLASRRYRTGYVYLWPSEEVPRLAELWSRAPVSGRAD